MSTQPPPQQQQPQGVQPPPPYVSDADWREAARDLHSLFSKVKPDVRRAPSLGAMARSGRPTLQALRSLHKSLRLFEAAAGGGDGGDADGDFGSDSVNWMQLFSEAMNLGDENERDEAVCAVELAFRRTALRVARRIVSELHLPNDRKTVKRSGIGGFAGTFVCATMRLSLYTILKQLHSCFVYSHRWKQIRP